MLAPGAGRAKYVPKKPKTQKGSKFLREIEKGFEILWDLFKRVRIFLHFPAWAQRVRSFRQQAAPSKNVKNKAAISIAVCLHKFITKMHFLGRSCGGALLVTIPPQGFEVLAPRLQVATHAPDLKFLDPRMGTQCWLPGSR